MPWSTRELARLAGTTLNTIRHYHKIGLLDEPKRRVNGYKQYGVPHLVTLLRIRRLVAIGVPLSQIHTVRDGENSRSGGLRAVDAELEVRISQLEQARREIGALLRNNAPADTPVGFESVASRLSEADSSMIHLYTQMYDEAAMEDIHRIAEDGAIEVTATLDNLLANADEHARLRVIDSLVPTLAQNFIDYPWLRDPASRLSKSGGGTPETFAEAMFELYSPAQLDVLSRASKLALEKVHAHETQDQSGPANT